VKISCLLKHKSEQTINSILKQTHKDWEINGVGDLIVSCGENDVYYENAFEIFNKWATNNPDIMAFYASIDLAFYNKEPLIYRQIKALDIVTDRNKIMDLQLCYRNGVNIQEIYPILECIGQNRKIVL
jgi:hypothetical protein